MTTVADHLKESMQPRLFVYAGKRPGENATAVDIIYLLNDDSTLGKKYAFKAVRYGRTIGGIYEGATFSDTSARGLAYVKFCGMWGGKVQPEIVEWTALTQAFEDELKAKRLEADAKKMNVIERQMEPLRAVYTALRERGAYSEMRAVKAAVLAALERAVK